MAIQKEMCVQELSTTGMISFVKHYKAPPTGFLLPKYSLKFPEICWSFCLVWLDSVHLGVEVGAGVMVSFGFFFEGMQHE